MLPLRVCFFTGDGRLVQCYQSSQVPLPTGGLPWSKWWGGDDDWFNHTTHWYGARCSVIAVLNQGWNIKNFHCFIFYIHVFIFFHFMWFSFVFSSPAGAQTDPKLHEGRLYGENRSKGLCCGSTLPSYHPSKVKSGIIIFITPQFQCYFGPNPSVCRSSIK